MTPEQEPKYRAVAHGQLSLIAGHLINRATGEAIPEDEPVFVFRARDKHAAGAIAFYGALCADPAHRAIVQQRVIDFHTFAARHPDRMKEPDSPA